MNKFYLKIIEGNKPLQSDIHVIIHSDDEMLTKCDRMYLRKGSLSRKN